VLDSDGNSGKVETPQGKSPRRLNSRPAESEHLQRKSTSTHSFSGGNFHDNRLKNSPSIF
jgi:pyrroline-5-carboxylate reductase